jgi:hypothetical protein
MNTSRPGFSLRRQVKVLYNDNGLSIRKYPFASHSEGVTRSRLMVRKKILPYMLIETTATKESLTPNHFRFD